MSDFLETTEEKKKKKHLIRAFDYWGTLEKGQPGSSVTTDLLLASPCWRVLRVGWLCLGGCAPGPRKSRLMLTEGSDQVAGRAALAPAP